MTNMQMTQTMPLENAVVALLQLIMRETWTVSASELKPLAVAIDTAQAFVENPVPYIEARASAEAAAKSPEVPERENEPPKDTAD